MGVNRRSLDGDMGAGEREEEEVEDDDALWATAGTLGWMAV